MATEPHTPHTADSHRRRIHSHTWSRPHTPPTMFAALRGGGGDGRRSDGPAAAAATTAAVDRTALISVVSRRLDADVQMAGPLFKRDTAGSSWAERHFVLKDSFIAYYETRSAGSAAGVTPFDIHPKGLLPLDGVDVELVRMGPHKDRQSGFRLSHPSFGTKSLCLCARDDAERDRWVAAITAASRV